MTAVALAACLFFPSLKAPEARAGADAPDALQARLSGLERVVFLDPSGDAAGDALTAMGRLREIQGHPGLAEDDYRKAIVIRSPLWEYAAYWLAGLLDREGRTEEALPLWRDLFDAGPSPSFREEAAAALVKSALAARRPADAVTPARVLAEASPDEAGPLADLASILDDAGLRNDAAGAVLDLWARFPTAPETRAFFDARPRWRTALPPPGPGLLLTRLRRLAEGGDFTALGRELPAFHPASPDEEGWATFLRGRLLEARGRHAEARRAYLSVQVPETAKGAAVVRMARMVPAARFPEKTLREIEAALASLPPDTQGRDAAFSALIRWHAAGKRRASAARVSELALSSGRPLAQASEFLYSTGWDLWLSGDRRGAAKFWRVLVDRLPPEADDRHAAVFTLLKLQCIADPEERRTLLDTVRREDANGYFGRMLGAEASAPAASSLLPPDPSGASRSHTDKGMRLLALGFGDASASELARSLGTGGAPDPEILWALARAQTSGGDFAGAIRTIRGLYRRAYAREGDAVPGPAWRMLYPAPYPDEVESAADAAGIDPGLVRSVIRQESLWDSEARSRSGARGLMQLMPGTARHVASTQGLKKPGASDLTDPAWNTSAGAAYLASMLKRYGGRAPLALAAYNAGPGRVDAWLRRANCPEDTDLFVESIPFRETRSYVRRVLLNTWEYARLYPKPGPKTGPAAPSPGE